MVKEDDFSKDEKILGLTFFPEKSNNRNPRLFSLWFCLVLIVNPFSTFLRFQSFHFYLPFLPHTESTRSHYAHLSYFLLYLFSMISLKDHKLLPTLLQHFSLNSLKIHRKYRKNTFSNPNSNQNKY